MTTRRDIHLNVQHIANEMEILAHAYCQVNGIDHDLVAAQFEEARAEALHQQRILEATAAAEAIAARRALRNGTP